MHELLGLISKVSRHTGGHIKQSQTTTESATTTEAKNKTEPEKEEKRRKQREMK
jgi:hypothetical protein